MEFLEKVFNMDYFWLPLVIFGGLLILGMVIGALQGWRVALYFLFWNALGWIISISTIGLIYDKVLQRLLDSTFEGIKNDLGDKLLTESFDLMKGIIVLVAALFIILAIDLIGLIIYFFVRKKIKDSNLQGKVKGYSSLNNRLLGSTFGFFSAIPFIATTGGLSVLISNNEKVNNFMGSFVKVATFNSVKSIDKDLDDLESIIQIIPSAKSFTKLFFDVDTFGKNDKYKVSENIPKWNRFLENDNIIHLMSEIVKHQSDNTLGIDLNMVNNLQTGTSEAEGVLAELSDKAQNNVRSILKDLYDTATLPEAQTEDLLNVYFK